MAKKQAGRSSDGDDSGTSELREFRHVAADNMIKIVQFQELSGGQDLIYIEHNGTLYSLRRTRSDRLLLHK